MDADRAEPLPERFVLIVGKAVCDLEPPGLVEVENLGEKLKEAIDVLLRCRLYRSEF